MRAQVTSPCWEPIIDPATRQAIEDVPFSRSGENALAFDFSPFGKLSTGLRFVIRVDSGSVTVLPETSHWLAGPADVGEYALAAFTVTAGQSYVVPLGLDNVPPFVRLWLQGTGAGVYTIERIPRG